MNVARLAGTARLKHAQTGCLHPLAGMRTPEPFEIADQRRRINSTLARLRAFARLRDEPGQRNECLPQTGLFPLIAVTLGIYSFWSFDGAST